MVSVQNLPGRVSEVKRSKGLRVEGFKGLEAFQIVIIAMCFVGVNLCAQVDTVWTRVFGGGSFDYGYGVRGTLDSGYIIGGYTSSYGAGGSDVWLIKVDANGNEVWNKTFGGSLDDAGYSVEVTSDGGYVIAGYTSSYGPGGGNVWLIKADANGNTVWMRVFGGNLTDYGYSVQPTVDGGYIIAGYTASSGAGGADVWLIKTDAAGNEVWNKTFGGGSDDIGYSVQQTVDSGYIIAGYTASSGAGGADVWLIKTDAAGNEVWNKTFGGIGSEYGYSVVESRNGGYIIAGYTSSYGAGGVDVWVIRTDANGNKLWSNTYGGGSDDIARNIQELQDGGCIITGHSSSYGAGEYDVWVIRTQKGLSITYPNGGELLKGGDTCIISWKTYGAPVCSLKLWYSVDGGLTYPNYIGKTANPTDSSYNWVLPAISSKFMRVKAEKYTDLGKECDVSDSNWTLDSDMPTDFVCISPSNNDTTGITPDFIWQSSTDTSSGFSHYELYIDGSVVDSTLTDTVYSLPFSKKLSGGVHSWFVRAYDIVGHFRETLHPNFYVVAFDLISPADSSFTNEGNPLFSWSSANGSFSHYQLYINEAIDRDSISTDSTSARSVAYLGEGSYTWYIVAVAFDGDTWPSNQKWVIRIDHTPPDSFGLQSPPNNSMTADSMLQFMWTSSGDTLSGLAKYQLWIDDTVKVDSIPKESTSTYSVVCEGEHSWYVRAWDEGGNFTNSDSTWIIKVDLTPPLPFSLLSPPNTEVVFSSTPTFVWHSSRDSISGVAKYELWVNGLLSVDNLLDTTCVPITPLVEGQNIWWVIVRDSVNRGRKSNETWTVIYELNPPEPFHLASPEDYDTVFVPPSPTLYWHPSIDAGVGLAKYQLWVDGLLDRDNIGAIDTFATPSESLSVGLHSWFIVAFDKVGKSTASLDTFRMIVQLDTIPPLTPVLIAPEDSAFINTSNVNFVWHSVEPGINYALMCAKDSGFVSPEIDTEIKDTSLTKLLSDTTYYWKVQAIDVAGNQSDWTAVWRFTLDSQIPSVPTLLAPADSITLSDNTPTFIWSKVSKQVEERDCFAHARNDRLEVYPNPFIHVASVADCKLQVASNEEKLTGTEISYNLRLICATDTTVYETQDTAWTIPSPLTDTSYSWQVCAFDEANNRSGYSAPFALFIDTQAPQISNTTVWEDTSFQGPFPVYCTITDNRKVDTAKLWFKTSVDTNWTSVLMDTTGVPNQYIAQIPFQPVNNTTVWYYIYSEDIAVPPNRVKDPANAPDSCYSFIAGYSGVEEDYREQITENRLEQNIPNPFIHVTSIEYQVSRPGMVSLKIYDLTGRVVRTLVDKVQGAAVYTVAWDGKNDSGKEEPSGIYFYRLEAEDYKSTKKMYLIR